ncbi:hypothetical protein ACVWYN_002085 [Pedobacter sp. UYP24]
MKRVIMFLIFSTAGGWLYACEVCQKQQPKILQGITHGGGPESQWDYVIVWAGLLLVLLTIFYSLKFIIRPSEKSTAHIKQTILNS